MLFEGVPEDVWQEGREVTQQGNSGKRAGRAGFAEV